MHGREAEQERIDALLDDALHSRAGVLEIVGDPGIGKSELCGHAAATPGFRVLRALGVQGEAGLSLAALFELLRPLAGHADDLPPGQRDAVHRLFDAGGAAGDRYALGAATLALLTRAAEEQPVLVLLDDAHWFDEPSGSILSFALRRLGADACAVLVSRRPVTDPPVAGPWPRHTLTGLARDAAAAVLGPAAAPPVCTALHAATGGNPLALRELARVLTPAQLAGRAGLPDPLPLSERGTAAFGWRVGDLPERTRRALVVVAAAGPTGAGLVGPALDGVGLAPADLDPAERAGLLELTDGRPAFPHPLVRAAAYAMAPGPQRRAAHRALAQAGVDGDVQRYALHLAAGTAVPSEEVAVALEVAALHAERRAGQAAGASARMRAAELTPEGPQRDRRRITAAHRCLLAGRRADATRLVRPLVTDPREGPLRWEALAMEASLALWGDDPAAAVPGLRAAVAELSGPAPDLAAQVSVQLVAVLLTMGRMEEMLDVARRGRDLAVTDPALRFLLEHRYGSARIWSGDLDGFADVQRRYPHAEHAQAARERYPMHDTMGPQMALFCEDFALARTLADEEVSGARRGGTPSALPIPLLVRGEIGMATGELLRARADLDEGAELAQQVGLVGLLGFGHALRARVAALEGDDRTARAFGALATDDGRRIGQQPVQLYVHHAVGLAELCSGRPAEAATRLDAAQRVAEVISSGPPLCVPRLGDHVEALHLAGRSADARVALDRLAGTAQGTGSRWARSVTARCRALLGDPDADALFDAAVSDQDETPVEAGRTLLAHGRALRRARRPGPARERLVAAVEILDRAGAAGWAGQARDELRAAGVRSTPARDTTHGLTAQELRVCLAVADGMTNREAAAALFVSPKTVEHHLSRAFGKLGVANRAQLARMVAEHGLSSS